MDPNKVGCRTLEHERRCDSFSLSSSLLIRVRAAMRSKTPQASNRVPDTHCHDENCREQLACSCLRLERVALAKFMGVFPDQRLSSETHIDQLPAMEKTSRVFLLLLFIVSV